MCPLPNNQMSSPKSDIKTTKWAHTHAIWQSDKLQQRSCSNAGWQASIKSAPSGWHAEFLAEWQLNWLLSDWQRKWLLEPALAMAKAQCLAGAKGALASTACKEAAFVGLCTLLRWQKPMLSIGFVLGWNDLRMVAGLGRLLYLGLAEHVGNLHL